MLKERKKEYERKKERKKKYERKKINIYKK